MDIPTTSRTCFLYPTIVILTGFSLLLLWGVASPSRVLTDVVIAAVSHNLLYRYLL
jgi:hypothetical protein